MKYTLSFSCAIRSDRWYRHVRVFVASLAFQPHFTRYSLCLWSILSDDPIRKYYPVFTKILGLHVSKKYKSGPMRLEINSRVVCNGCRLQIPLSYVSNVLPDAINTRSCMLGLADKPDSPMAQFAQPFPCYRDSTSFHAVTVQSRWKVCDNCNL